MTRWTNIIQKRRTGFYGDKNFNLVVVFCGIFLLVHGTAPNFPGPLLFTHLDIHLKHTWELAWGPLGSLQTKASKSGKNIEACEVFVILKTYPQFWIIWVRRASLLPWKYLLVEIKDFSVHGKSPNFSMRLRLRTRRKLMLANFRLKIRAVWDSDVENRSSNFSHK